MQPTGAMRSSVLRTAPNVVIPGLVVAGAVYGVVSYVRSQLIQESNTMNRMFAKQNSPRVMESRKRNFMIETEGDPRKTPYNILNWQ